MTYKLLPRLLAAMAMLTVCLWLPGCAGGTAGEHIPASTPPTETAAPPAPSAATPLPKGTPQPAAYEKADYLNYKFAYSITKESLGDKLADTAKKECTAGYSKAEGTADVAALCESWVYDGTAPGAYSCGAVFLTWSADLCGLIDAGAFLRSTDLNEIYNFLTEVNEFPTQLLTNALQFGKYEYKIKAGDILFWTDDDGSAVNAGIVTQVLDASIFVAICDSESSVASFELTQADREAPVIKRCTLVQVEYPYNEQLVFLYLVNELGYTNAVASGALANIYCESLFEPNIEEQDFSEGYGLCQWTGARRAALEMWCAANSMDHSKLNNQLAYMKYELENDVAGDLDLQLRRLGNSDKDAYNAGVLWCDRFENPGEDEAKQRGILARDSFFPAYSGHPYM